MAEQGLDRHMSIKTSLTNVARLALWRAGVLSGGDVRGKARHALVWHNEARHALRNGGVG